MKKLLFMCFFFCPSALDAQIISTFAGNGICGDYGNGNQATSAQLEIPGGGAFDQLGNYYFFEMLSNVIRKISVTGIMSVVAGTGVAGFYGDEGPATAAELNGPVWVATDKNGNIYIADHGNGRIRKIDLAGTIHSVAGNGTAGFSGDGGAATAASFLFGPYGICIDDTGNIYECEITRVRKINSSGIISTVVGTGVVGYNGDGGPATAAQIHAFNIATDKDNNLFIADIENYKVRKVSFHTGIINTIAGTGVAGYNGDNIQATAAQLGETQAIAIDPFGNLFIADWNQRIRKVDKNGLITTFAGTGVIGYNGDGIPAGLAQIHDPEGIAFDSCGNLFFTDGNNCRIRKISYPHCNYLSIEQEESSNANAVFYPNPTPNQLVIKILETSTYRLINILGTTTQQGTLKAGDNTISIKALPPGMYMLELTDEDRNRTVTKIIKQ
jgi:hypothetical protein